MVLKNYMSTKHTCNFQEFAHSLGNLHFIHSPDFICHMKTDVKKITCSEIIFERNVVPFSHLWSVTGIKEHSSVHLNKQKHT